MPNAELEIERQQTHATREPELRALLEGHDTERKRVKPRPGSAKSASDCSPIERESSHPIAAGGALAAQGTLGTIPGATALIAVFDTEIERLAGIDLEMLRTRREEARRLAELDQQRSKATAKLDQMEKLAVELTREVDELARHGTPVERLKSTQNERAVLQQAASAAYSVAAQTELRATQLRTLEQSLRASEFGELCPTCARPFQPGEATQTLNALAEQVSLLERDIRAERATAEQMTQQAAELAAVETRLTGDVERFQNLNGRLETGRTMIEAQEREVATFELELGLRLRESGRTEVPGPHGNCPARPGRAAGGSGLRPKAPVWKSGVTA